MSPQAEPIERQADPARLAGRGVQHHDGVARQLDPEHVLGDASAVGIG